MPYVRGFDNDVFISYAHADNTEGWVNTFHTRLQNRIRQFDRNANVSIWCDPKLGGADVFSDQILNQLKSSALLISILSPNGFTSDWCQQERQRFEQFAETTGGFRIGDKIRAMKVVKTPLPNDAHRSVFGTLGFEFYERDSQTGRFQEFDESGPRFRDRLDEVAQEVWAILNNLQMGGGAKPPLTTVYVATVTDDLKERRKQIVRQFTAWNCRVLPEENTLPAASPELRSAIDSHLSQCAFTVHPVSAQRGMIPDGEDQSVIVLQYELARDRGLERIVWTPKDSVPHASFQSALAKGTQTGLDRLESKTIDDLLQFLEERIKSLLAAPLTDANSSLRNIYVLCDPNDWDSAYRLKACLESNQCAVWYPMRDVDDERVRLRDHQETLKSSDAVLLYWGSAQESWFRRSLRELIGARQKRRKRPLPALCLSCPPNPDRDQYQRPDVFFAQVHDLRCETVRPALRHLHTCGNGGEQ